jgi:hypothetical protein
VQFDFRAVVRFAPHRHSAADDTGALRHAAQAVMSSGTSGCEHRELDRFTVVGHPAIDNRFSFQTPSLFDAVTRNEYLPGGKSV